MNRLTIVLITLQVGITMLSGVANARATDAQTQKSRIEGVVLDRNEARIVGAVITIKNADFTRRLRSNDEGRFELELPSGSYEIRVEQPGFKTFRLASLRADAGATAQINIHLEVKPPRGPLKIIGSL